MKRFALIGAGGYIAPRHVQAIHATGNQLVAAVDPHDCVGHLDQYFPDTRFFTEIERFDRFLDKCRRGQGGNQIDYVSICSPNYLHDAHVRMALRSNADVLCEKPLVISPWNLDAMEELEQECGRRVFTVLQLRLLPAILKLKETLKTESHHRDEICLTYVTRRGPWYHSSWKGALEKSGGVAMNIGIHFFDLLLWLFGHAEQTSVHLRNEKKMAGTLELERARVRWLLSIDTQDLPDESRQAGKHAYRQMSVNGECVDLSSGFTELHTRVYENLLAGRGLGIREARPAIELIHDINGAVLNPDSTNAHPYVVNGSSSVQPQSKAA